MLILGGRSEIGIELARRLASGATVILAARKADQLAEQVAALVAAGATAVHSQVDGARRLSLEGRSKVNSDADAVRDAELRYAQRYRTPRVNPRRVVIEVQIERVLGSSDLLTRKAD